MTDTWAGIGIMATVLAGTFGVLGLLVWAYSAWLGCSGSQLSKEDIESLLRYQRYREGCR